MSIVITGSPGVGKHTISAILADIKKLELVDLNDVARRADLIDSEGQVDLKELALKLENVTENNLVVGHLAPYVLQSEKVSTAIVLRRSPYTLESVYKERSYSHDKQLANLGSEILGIVAHDAIKRFGRPTTRQIDNTTREPENTVALVLRALDESDYAGEDVDWLELVDKRGDMQRFFSY